MATTAPPTDHCATCAAPLAGDQQYCLNCGRRVGPERTDLLGALRGPEREVDVLGPPPLPAPGPRLLSPLGGAALTSLLALGLLVGALLWSGEEERPIVVNVPRDEAPRVNVSVPAGGGTAAAAEVTSDWPGDDGWTIQLTALPKDGTDPAAVQAAKAEATGKGVEDVGVLDSDEYPSLDPGEFVVYSGVYSTRKAARADLRTVRKEYPKAKVVEVSASGEDGDAPAPEADAQKASDADLEELQDAKGDDFVKKSKKLKDKVATGGAVPEKDEKAPGGGSGEGAVIE